MTDGKRDLSGSLAAVEPSAALLIGGLLGATTFFLCALLFGARIAIAIATVAMLTSIARRVPAAVVVFTAAATLAAVGLLPSTLALVAASAAFGIGLALFARERILAPAAAANT